MSGTESNSVGCSKLLDVKGCREMKTSEKGKHYSVDVAQEPRILFVDAIGNGREMKFKRNSTVTITHEKILYNRDDVEIKPASKTQADALGKIVTHYTNVITHDPYVLIAWIPLRNKINWPL